MKKTNRMLNDQIWFKKVEQKMMLEILAPPKSVNQVLAIAMNIYCKNLHDYKNSTMFEFQVSLTLIKQINAKILNKIINKSLTND
jgi:hypothetical protein